LPACAHKKKDWSAEFSEEQKALLSELLSIVPASGPSIEEDHATWWIKHFGMEAVKTAVAVYLQRVSCALTHKEFEAPKQIGACIREPSIKRLRSIKQRAI